MDLQVVARIMHTNRLSEVMVGALTSGQDGKRVQSGPKQIRALIERGFLNEEDETLTALGCVVLDALNTGYVAPENEARVFPASAPGGSTDLYFITDNDRIRPIAEADEGTPGLSWGMAKARVIADATARRKADAALIKATRSLRKSDLNPEVDMEGSV